MAEHVSFDYSLAKGVIGQDELTSMKAAVLAARDTLENKKGAGNDFLGWIDLPEDYDKEEFARKKVLFYETMQKTYRLFPGFCHDLVSGRKHRC